MKYLTKTKSERFSKKSERFSKKSERFSKKSERFSNGKSYPQGKSEKNNC